MTVDVESPKEKINGLQHVEQGFSIIAFLRMCKRIRSNYSILNGHVNEPSVPLLSPSLASNIINC